MHPSGTMMVRVNRFAGSRIYAKAYKAKGDKE